METNRHKSGHKPLLFKIAAGFLGVAVVGYALWPSEPRWQGRSLSSWLVDLTADKPQGTRISAAAAVRAVGTNAVPFLLDWMQAPGVEPQWKLRLQAWLSRQSLIKVKFEMAVERRRESVLAFEALGDAGRSAVAELAKLLFDPDANRRGDAAAALAGIGAASVPAGLTGLQSQDQEAQRLSVGILGAIAAEPETVVPALLAKIDQADQSLRSELVRCLGEFGRSARVAVPELTRLLRTGDSGIDAAYALAGIGAIIPLLEATTNTNRATRVGALGALAYKEQMKTYPNAAEEGRYTAMQKRTCLFNLTTLHLATQMYSPSSREALAWVFKPYLQSLDPDVRAAASNSVVEMAKTARPKSVLQPPALPDGPEGQER
jgi:hypothetical protein